MNRKFRGSLPLGRFPLRGKPLSSFYSRRKHPRSPRRVVVVFFFHDRRYSSQGTPLRRCFWRAKAPASFFLPGPRASPSRLNRHTAKKMLGPSTSSASLVLLLLLLLVLLHVSYSRREAAVRRFDAPTWPNWKKPVSSLRSSFFACILAFCTANTSTLLLLPRSLSLRSFSMRSVLVFLFSFTRAPILSLLLSLCFSLSFSSLSLSLSLSRCTLVAGEWCSSSSSSVGESPRDFMIRRDQIHLCSAVRACWPRAQCTFIPNCTLPSWSFEQARCVFRFSFGFSVFAIERVFSIYSFFFSFFFFLTDKGILVALLLSHSPPPLFFHFATR